MVTASLERRYADRVEEYARQHPLVIDLAIILPLMGSAGLGSSLTMPGADPPQQRSTALLLMGLSCLVLLKYRTHPRTALVVSTVCTVITIVLGYLVTPLLLAPVMAALFWLATLTDRATTRTWGIVAVTALGVSTVLSNSMAEFNPLLRTMGPLFWMLLPLALGKMTQLRGAYLEAVQSRAEHAERTREEEARLRVAEERMRIARELHDVVAHHLALANAQAGTAAHLSRSNPEQSQKILEELTGTTSSALRELKATLGLLRQDDVPENERLQPAPGLARLPELISACASAGLAVKVTTEGVQRPLSPGVDLTAFRIVQEALTNVAKHADTRTAHVSFTYAAARLLITVADDGPATGTTAPPTRGFGLMGMRERAHSIGGELRAGPRPEGGFQVTTVLPLQPADSAASAAGAVSTESKETP